MTTSRAVPDRFADRVAVVTGAASGIGAATASRLAAEGAIVLVTDINPAGQSVADTIKDAGGRADFVELNVADEDGWRTVASAAEDLGGAGVLVSNAALIEIAPVHELDLASWDRQLAVCLTATYLGVRALLPQLVRHRGSVVVSSSVHAKVGLPGHPAYASAKGGLGALVRQLAVDYGPEVRVNAVVPGPIMTSMWDRVADEERDKSVQATVLRRFGEPDEVAAGISFLAGDDASFVTGTELVIDGGWSISKVSA
jgi:glucose 1-dehydrogenase